MSSHLTRFLGLLGLLLVLPAGMVDALAQGATPAPAGITLPAPTGPYSVGRTLADWNDPARVEPYTLDPADTRDMAVWIWYPAAPDPEAEPAPYLPGAWGEAVGAALGFDPTMIRTHAGADASFSPTDVIYPVVLLSPGTGFFPAVYTAFAEELASHGYVVVGVNHTYNASVTAFSDGRVVATAPEAQLAPGELDEIARVAEAIVEVHAADLAFVLDRLQQANDQPGLLQGKLDLSRVGVLGGSLGGAVAAELCRVDRRCDAAVNMDGAFWGEAAETGVPVPFLLLMAEQTPCTEQATQEQVTVEQCEAIVDFFIEGWETLHDSAQPGYWFAIAGSRHGSYSDAPFLPLPPALAEPFLGGATIAPERMWRVTSDLLLAFFDRHLNVAPAPILDAPDAAYPEVAVMEAGAATPTEGQGT